MFGLGCLWLAVASLRKVLQGRAFAMLLAGGDFRCRAEKTVNLHCSRQKIDLCAILSRERRGGERARGMQV